MCGIIFTDLLGKAKKRVLKRYGSQSGRGKEGYGAVSIEKNFIKQVYRSVDEGGIRKLLSDDESNSILFHHRRPTNSPNIIECTHPICVSNETLKNSYYVVHNGVINNAPALRKKYEELGFEYETVVEKIIKPRGGVATIVDEVFNDSESFAIDIARSIENGNVLIDSVGSIAFIAIQYDKYTAEVLNIYFGRNWNNPLLIDTSEGFLLASEGRGVEVEPNNLFCYNFKTKQTTNRYIALGVRKYIAPVNKQEPQSPTIVPKVGTQTSIEVEFYHSTKGIMKEKFTVNAGLLFRTTITTDAIPFMTDRDWDTYLDLNKKFDYNIQLFIYDGEQPKDKKMSDEDLQEIKEDMKKIRLQYHSLSLVVNVRLINNNKK